MKTYKWNDVKVMLCGVELTGITSISFSLTVSELQLKLIEAESAENYKLCAKIKKKMIN